MYLVEPFLGARYLVNTPPPSSSSQALYQIHCQSLNTHRGKHKSGGAKFAPISNDSRHHSPRRESVTMSNLTIRQSSSIVSQFSQAQSVSQNLQPEMITKIIPKLKCDLPFYFKIIPRPNFHVTFLQHKRIHVM